MTGFECQIVELMNERGMSQAELSRLSGVPSSSLSRYVSGDDIPASKLRKLADALGVTTDKLLGIERDGLTPDEAALVGLYRSMDARGRSVLMSTAMALSE